MRTEAGLGLRRKAEAIVRRHWNVQRLLEPLPVVIPFATQLSFPSSWMRTRRDHARFLNLIEVSAFLHQYQRVKKSGAIVATVEDYEVAYRLAKSVLTDTLSDLKASVRKTYEHIRKLSLRRTVESFAGVISVRRFNVPRFDGPALARRARGARLPGSVNREAGQGDSLSARRTGSVRSDRSC